MVTMQTGVFHFPTLLWVAFVSIRRATASCDCNFPFAFDGKDHDRCIPYTEDAAPELHEQELGWCCDDDDCSAWRTCSEGCAVEGVPWLREVRRVESFDDLRDTVAQAPKDSSTTVVVEIESDVTWLDEIHIKPGQHVEIVGLPAAQVRTVTLDAQDKLGSPFFYVWEGGVLSLHNLKLANGFAPKRGFSAMVVDGTIDLLSNCMFEGGNWNTFEANNNNIRCTNISPLYGAIFVETSGAINAIRNTTFQKNRSEKGGAAIWNEGRIGTISESTFIENRASGGGALFNNEVGVIDTISQCEFIRNNGGNVDMGTMQGGGAIYNMGKISVVLGSTFTHNVGRIGGSILMLPLSDVTTETLIVDSIFEHGDDDDYRQGYESKPSIITIGGGAILRLHNTALSMSIDGKVSGCELGHIFEMGEWTHFSNGCIACPPGYYMNRAYDETSENMNTECFVCPKGMVATTPGQESCTVCPSTSNLVPVDTTACACAAFSVDVSSDGLSGTPKMECTYTPLITTLTLLATIPTIYFLYKRHKASANKVHALKRANTLAEKSLQSAKRRNAELARDADEALLNRALAAEAEKEQAHRRMSVLAKRHREERKSKRRIRLQQREKRKVQKAVVLTLIFGALEIFDCGTDANGFALFAANHTKACVERGTDETECETLLPIYTAFVVLALIASVGTLGLRFLLIREAVSHYRHGISSEVVVQAEVEAGGKITFKLAEIRRGVLEGIATLLLSFMEDIPMGYIAWHRITNLQDHSVVTLLTFFSSTLMLGLKLYNLQKLHDLTNERSDLLQEQDNLAEQAEEAESNSADDGTAGLSVAENGEKN